VIRAPQIHDPSASCGGLDSLDPFPNHPDVAAKDRIDNRPFGGISDMVGEDLIFREGRISDESKNGNANLRIVMRLQSDLAQLSTNSRQVMVSGTGHEIYIYQPAIVVRSISAVVTSAQKHSPLPPIE
jgi:hypothetical protein